MCAMTTIDLSLPVTEPSPVDVAVENNLAVIRKLHATPGGGSTLRALRFRPQRELLLMREAAAAQAQARLEAEDVDGLIVDMPAAVAADLVVSTLDSALQVSAPANQITDPPRGTGYMAVPFPLDANARETLYAHTERLLKELLPRHLPGTHDGWSWRVEINVSDDDRSLRVVLTPRNERYENPVAPGDFTDPAALPAREPVEVTFVGGPLDGKVRTTAALSVDVAGLDSDEIVTYVVDPATATATIPPT